MTLDISVFIFLSVILIGFGYVAGNARYFNIWKLLLLGIILLPFIHTFNMGKPHLLTMLGAFLFGYFLPYANNLGFIGEGLSDFINAIRYRDAYDDIKQKEAEVEELRKKYQQSQKETNKQKAHEEYQRRKKQSQDYRKQQKSEEQQEKSSKSSNYKTNNNNSSNSVKNKYLQILDLEENKTYSYAEIKKAYRKQASKYHPDKHFSKGEKVVQEMSEKFKEVQNAYEWLALI